MLAKYSEGKGNLINLPKGVLTKGLSTAITFLITITQ